MKNKYWNKFLKMYKHVAIGVPSIFQIIAIDVFNITFTWCTGNSYSECLGKIIYPFDDRGLYPNI